MTHTDHRGFLFIEGSLMVLVAGTGILSAALFPSLTAYLARGRDTSRVANIKDIATAIANYETDNVKLPPVPPSGCASRSVVTPTYLPKMLLDPVGHAAKGCDGSDGTYTYRILNTIGISSFALQAEMESPRGGNSDVDLDTILAGPDPAGVIDNLQRGS